MYVQQTIRKVNSMLAFMANGIELKNMETASVIKGINEAMLRKLCTLLVSLYRKALEAV